MFSLTICKHSIAPPLTNHTNASRHIWQHPHLTYPIPAHPCHRMHTSVPCRHPYVHIRKSQAHHPAYSHHPRICFAHPITLSQPSPIPMQPHPSHLLSPNDLPPCNHTRSTPEPTRLLGTLKPPAAYASVTSIGHHHAPSTLHPLFLTLNRP